MNKVLPNFIFVLGSYKLFAYLIYIYIECVCLFVYVCMNVYVQFYCFPAQFLIYFIVLCSINQLYFNNSSIYVNYSNFCSIKFNYLYSFFSCYQLLLDSRSTVTSLAHMRTSLPKLLPVNKQSAQGRPAVLFRSPLF